jgi:hypothetical protein
VVGPDSADNSQYTRWAEEIAGRMERLLAVSLPPLGREPIEIIRVSGRLAGPAMRIDCRPEGTTRRVMTINESRIPDYERMQESLCALLLDGYVEERRRALGRRAGLFVVPQWLSMGVSQNLAAETRNRSRKVVTGWFPSSQRPGVVTVLGWMNLPDGWPRNWALCGMVVHWLGSTQEGTGAYASILDRLADGEPVNSDWVAARVCRAGSVAALERDWNDWLQRQSRVIQEFGALTTVLVEQLKAELDLVFVVAPSAGGDGSSRRLTPAQVAAEKNPSISLRLAASEKSHRIRAVTLGQAPELIDVGEAYCRFFEAVSRDAWAPVVRFRQSRADAAFARLARQTRAQEAYLDEVERELRGGRDAGDGSFAGNIEPVLEKSRIDAYLDEAEKRFDQTSRKGTGRRTRL